MRSVWIVAVALLLAGCPAPGPLPSPGTSPSAKPSSPGATPLVPTPTPPPLADAPLPSPLPEVVARLDGEPIYLIQIVPMTRAKLDRVIDPDRQKPALMRAALREYIDRELLLKEALARGVQADTRTVQRLYDQARADFPDEAKWKESLYQKGFDPQSFRTEVRVQQTIALFLARQTGTEDQSATEEAMAKRAGAARALLLELRAKSRIETYL
jgi:hypothetical protein